MKTTLAILILFINMVSAQITSAEMSGRILVDEKPLINVELVLIHTPTNYSYISVTNSKGYFEFTDLQVGGPYELIIPVGDEKFIKKYRELKLGENEINPIKIKKS